MQEAWEFRYDESGRQRYYARRWTPDEQHPTDPRYFVADPTMEWTDYLGAQPYGDYTVSVDGGTPVATPLHRYLAGLGIHAQQTVDGQGDPTVYLHGDMVRSTMLTTDEAGQPVGCGTGFSPVTAYTAFGEPVTYDAGSQTWRVGFPAAGGMGGSPVTRYQYAGGFGYESGLITLQGVNPALPPVTLQHVGERWYDPAIGRFVQRDPIGLAGGVNVYAYVLNSPVVQADPTGKHLLCDMCGKAGGHRSDCPYYVKDPGPISGPVEGAIAGVTFAAVAAPLFALPLIAEPVAAVCVTVATGVGSAAGSAGSAAAAGAEAAAPWIVGATGGAILVHVIEEVWEWLWS